MSPWDRMKERSQFDRDNDRQNSASAEAERPDWGASGRGWTDDRERSEWTASEGQQWGGTERRKTSRW